MKELKEGQVIDGVHVWRGRMKFRVLRTFWDRVCEAVLCDCELLEGHPRRSDSEWRKHDPGDIITILPSHIRLKRSRKIDEEGLAKDEINI